MADDFTIARELSNIQNQVADLARYTQMVGNSVQESNAKIDNVNYELQKLKEEFDKMVNDQRRTASLQQASTELIRVRQEIESEFSGYRVVRETMLGVLQATDVALVKKTTISRVSEELMLTTPEYWLAPCLIAVAAWIGNDKPLADRAIAEAMRRDEERTSLTMALICRRNNRTDVCYEWLARYFAKQDAANFSEGSFTYLNAYLNGVFGEDKNHMCDDYVSKWMSEIRENGADFEKDQIQRWADYCRGFETDVDRLFPDLGPQVQESGRIKDYVRRINAAEPIMQKFDSIVHAEVNQKSLREEVDRSLVNLVSRYDPKEEPLRREERYLSAIKYFEGDREAAKRAILEQDEKRKERTIDLIGQMTNVVMEEKSIPSEKKTAVSFLRGYINQGFENYISEKKEDFPKQITIEMDGWTGVISDGNDLPRLKSQYQIHLNQEREQQKRMMESKRTNGIPIPTLALLVAAGVLFIIGMIGAGTGAGWGGVMIFLGIVGLVCAGVWYYKIVQTNKNMDRNIEQIEQHYDQLIADGSAKLDRIVVQWMKARNVVYTYEHETKKEIVA